MRDFVKCETPCIIIANLCPIVKFLKLYFFSIILLFILLYESILDTLYLGKYEASSCLVEHMKQLLPLKKYLLGLQSNNYDKPSVINDPLGQTHSLASREHCFLLFCFSRFEKWGRTYGWHARKQWSLQAMTLGWPSGSKADSMHARWRWYWKSCLLIYTWNDRRGVETFTSFRQCHIFFHLKFQLGSITIVASRYAIQQKNFFCIMHEKLIVQTSHMSNVITYDIS